MRRRIHVSYEEEDTCVLQNLAKTSRRQKLSYNVNKNQKNNLIKNKKTIYRTDFPEAKALFLRALSVDPVDLATLNNLGTNL
jgi:hypothetical protein